MQMIQITIHGEKFEGDFLNPDVMERYENAIDRARTEAARQVEGESGSQGVRRQCDVVRSCIDTVLGEGSADKLMPGGPDLLTCLDIFEELCLLGEKQITPLIQRRVMKYSARRAARNAKSSD